MRNAIPLVLAAILLSGCASFNHRDRNTLIGASVGAGVGALVGSAAGGPPAAWAGAAIGGVTGGAIGYLVEPKGCFMRDRRGNEWRVQCQH